MAKSTPIRPSASRIVSEEEEVVSNPSASGHDTLIFGKATFIWIGIGVVMMLVGMALMAGGGMPSPDVWDDELIYSFRRITLAPIVILAGLGVITYAILKK
ncbi:MAG: DUF3098 domain-containing protein [Saprospiraceae bacterium]